MALKLGAGMFLFDLPLLALVFLVSFVRCFAFLQIVSRESELDSSMDTNINVIPLRDELPVIGFGRERIFIFLKRNI